MALSDRFRDQAGRFIQDALAVIRSRCDPRDLPTTPAFSGEPRPHGGLRIILNPRPNWYQLPVQVRQHLRSLPSFSDASRSAESERALRSIFGTWVRILDRGIKYDSAEDLISGLIGDYLDGLRVPVFWPRRVAQRLNALEDFVNFHKPAIVHALAPLEGFAMRPRLVKLGDGMQIVRFSNSELLRMINRLETFSRHYGIAFHPWFRYAFTIRLSVPKVREEAIPRDTTHPTVALLLNREILLLRSLTGLHASAVTFAYDYPGWPAAMLSGGSIAELPWQRAAIPAFDALTKAHVVAYKRLRERALQITDRGSAGRISTAMRRLAFALDRPHRGDQLADAVVGLEALYLDGREELRHRLAERGSLYLTERPKERALIWKELRSAYDRRSDVVHGRVVFDHFGFGTLPLRLDASSPSGEEIKQFNEIQRLAPRVLQHLRESIRRTVKRGSVLTEGEWEEAVMKSPRVE